MFKKIDNGTIKYYRCSKKTGDDSFCFVGQESNLKAPNNWIFNIYDLARVVVYKPTELHAYIFVNAKKDISCDFVAIKNPNEINQAMTYINNHLI